MVNNLVKGSLMRKKLQNSKGYAEPLEFLPELGQQCYIMAIQQFYMSHMTHIAQLCQPQPEPTGNPSNLLLFTVLR